MTCKIEDVIVSAVSTPLTVDEVVVDALKKELMITDVIVNKVGC